MAVDNRQVPIQRPCPVTLAADRHASGARSWHCDHCDKRVHVLSNMTESEARGFLQTHAGEKVCVTYAVDAGGAIRFRPEPPAIVPVASLTRRRAVAAVGLGLALAACTPHDRPAGATPVATARGVEATIPARPAPAVDETMWLDGEVAVRPVVEPPPPMMRGEVAPVALREPSTDVPAREPCPPAPAVAVDGPR